MLSLRGPGDVAWYASAAGGARTGPGKTAFTPRPRPGMRPGPHRAVGPVPSPGRRLTNEPLPPRDSADVRPAGGTARRRARPDRRRTAHRRPGSAACAGRPAGRTEANGPGRREAREAGGDAAAGAGAAGGVRPTDAAGAGP